MIRNSSVGAIPHRTEIDAERDEADDEDPAPAVAVGEGAGDDQERGQDREVAAADVGLALEDAERREPRQLLADPLQGEVHDRAVEEDDPGARRSPRAGSSAGPRVMRRAVSHRHGYAHAHAGTGTDRPRRLR